MVGDVGICKRRCGRHFAVRIWTDAYPPYELLEDVCVAGLVVPKGFMFDGASVPRFARPFFDRLGRNALAALVHDYMYATGCRPRREADRILYDLLVEQRVSVCKAWIVWMAVRLFGVRRWTMKRLEL